MHNKNSLWSLAGGAVPAFCALIFMPVLISSLGLDRFAFVSLILSVTLFFYVYDLGMSRTMTYLLANIKDKESRAHFDLIATALLSVFLLGLTISIILYFLIPYFVSYWLNIKGGMLNEIVESFRIVILGILPGLISNTLKGVIESDSKFKESSICKMFSGASIFLAPMIVVLFFKDSLIFISLSIVISRYIGMLVYIFYALPLKQFLASKVNKKHFNAIWTYGLWAAVSGFISTTFVYGDRFIVAGYISPQDLSLYISSQDVLIRYLLIPWSMAIVLMPIFSSNDMSKKEVIDLFRRQQKRISFISIGLLLLIIVLIIGLIEVYKEVGIPDNTKYIVLIQIVGIYFCAISQLPLVYLYSQGVPKLITFIFVFELFLYLVFAPIVFNNLGVIGACFIWTGRLILEYKILAFYAKRLMR